MSQKSSEIFPDVHLKMSKKIAQLTKVIYHLNTKNDDHDLEISKLNERHQGEIQQILRDAAAKVNQFKGMLDARQVCFLFIIS